MEWTVFFLFMLIVFQWLALSNQSKVIENLKAENNDLVEENKILIEEKSIKIKYDKKNVAKQNIMCYNCINGFKNFK